MLSRKYYKMIAKTIKDNTITKNGRQYIGKSNIMYDLCAEFRRDNNNFNTQRFIEACKDD